MPPATIAFLPATIGPFELLIIFTLILLLFGAKRLPEVARTLGNLMTDLRRTSRDFHDQILQDVDPQPPRQAPLERTATKSTEEPSRDDGPQTPEENDAPGEQPVHGDSDEREK